MFITSIETVKREGVRALRIPLQHDPAIDDPAASGTVFNWLDRESLPRLDTVHGDFLSQECR